MAVSAFRVGDIRGIYPTEINEEFSYQFALAFTERFKLRGKVATGRDVRSSSSSLQQSLISGFTDAGINVIDLGVCPTEIGSFASTREGIDAVIIVTASHNAPDFNGLKCILNSGEVVSYETGLSDIEHMLRMDQKSSGGNKGNSIRQNFNEQYIEHIEKLFEHKNLKSGPIAANGLNGTASTLATSLAEDLDINLGWLRKEPGPIPDEGSDPTHPVLVAEMKRFMLGKGFELGVAWDGDCDRCVFFDHEGNLIPSYYMIGLFTRHLLDIQPGAAIVYDTKLCWNTLQIINECGGVPVRSRTGHAFMKQKMREHRAVYGGELSSHHYFGDFFYCDSGMNAWLKCLELVSQSNLPLAELVDKMRKQYQCLPEISLNLGDVDRAFNEIDKSYSSIASSRDPFDGISFEFNGTWRFSLRRSKTEPLVRLNFESRSADESILEEARKLLIHLKSFQVDDENWQDLLCFQ